MSLPPLANLLAFTSPDATELEALARRLTEERFGAVHRPHPRWVLASAPLPGGTPDAPPARQAGLQFAEGRDRVEPLGFERAARIAAEGGRIADLPGDVTLVRIAADGAATISRSAGGMVPMYLDRDGDRVLVTTRYADMLRFRRRTPVLDPLVNAIWTSGAGAFPDGRTFAEDVTVLPRGHVARVDARGTVTTERWWDARPHDARELRRGPENARELRAALLETLDRELDGDGESLLTLSGGVDSSAVGALAAGSLGRRLVSASLLPVAVGARARDAGYIDGLAARFPNLRLGPREVLTADLRLALMAENPVPFPVLQPIIGMLPRIVAAEPDVRVVVGGEFADHTCGSTMILDDWAAHTSPWALARSLGRLPRGRRDVRPWLGHRVRELRHTPRIPFAPDLPDLVRDDVREEYREWRDRRVRAAAADERPRRYLAMLLEREGFLGMHWEMTSALNVRRCFPFVTRRVLELSLRTHPADLVGPGTKKLLRDALGDDVPREHLFRADKGRPGPGEDRSPRTYAGPVPAALDAVIRPGLMDEKPMPYWGVLRLTQLVAFASACEHARANRARVGASSSR